MGRDSDTTKANKIIHGSPEKSLVTKLSGDVHAIISLERRDEMDTVSRPLW